MATKLEGNKAFFAASLSESARSFQDRGKNLLKLCKVKDPYTQENKEKLSIGVKILTNNVTNNCKNKKKTI